jgi:lactate dehydrogenase-like 2-hydroxyacid dehydrogenase
MPRERLTARSPSASVADKTSNFRPLKRPKIAIVGSGKVGQALAKALKKAERAKKPWHALSFTHNREYIGWISEAKKPETRARRIAETIARLE